MQRSLPTQFVRRHVTVALVAAFLCFLGTGWSAPEFVLSGRLSELDATVLAADANGPVTALETLLYLDIAGHPARDVPVEFWLSGAGERRPEITKRIRDGIEEFLAARSLARQQPAVELPPFLERRALYSAAEAAWIEVAVTPEIRIEDEDISFYYIAHAERYTKRRSAQVRYIFLGIPEGSTAAESSRRQSELDDLRERILRGELTFDTAAKLYSEAPSKERGGLIPSFAEGDYFQEFERNAFGLQKIGDMSPVFLGPGGVYMVQLVSESQKPIRVPVADVSDDIRAVLRHQHVRPYYVNALTRLFRDHPAENFSSLWEYIDENAPVARVAHTDLTRDQLLQIDPSIINARYDVQGGRLVTETQAWIEGETVMQELERIGQTDHRLISKARRIAHTFYAAQANLRGRVDQNRIDTPLHALDTLRSGSPVASGIPEAHVILLSILPNAGEYSLAGVQALQSDTIRRLSDTISQGFVPTRPDPTEYMVAIRKAAEQSDEAVSDLVKKFTGQIEAAPWPDARVEIRDLGWIEALPGLSANPAIPALRPGEVSAPQTLGTRVDFFYVGALRGVESTPWLEYPLVLQVAAFDAEARRLLQEEVARVRKEQGTIALP